MDNLILIGMPSSGKTTAGRLAAELLSMRFLDTDELIAKTGGAPLCDLIDALGKEGFLRLEERVCMGLDVHGCVIATGGSVVYSDGAMRRLKALGPAVYLKTRLETVKRRIPDFAARGVVMRGEISSLDGLYSERAPLYERYADMTIDCDGQTAAETANRIAAFAKENL